MKKCANENCILSGTLQPDENFHKNKQNSDGLHSYCKKCRNKSRSEYHKTFENKKIKKRNKAGEELLEKAKKRVGFI